MGKYGEEQLSALLVIESLRAGVPTRKSTDVLPDVRPYLMQPIFDDLAKFKNGERPKGRLLWGDFGLGKSHALKTIEHKALDEGFAVSMVSFTIEDHCQNLFNFHARVASSVRTPHSTELGLQTYLKKKSFPELSGNTQVLQKGRYVNPQPAVVLATLLKWPDTEEGETLYGDLTGDHPSRTEIKRIVKGKKGDPPSELFDLLAMTPFKRSEHAQAYFGLLADTIAFCGFKGWVILIDEIELLCNFSQKSRLEPYRNLNWLLNWNDSMNYPIYTVCAAASTTLHKQMFEGDEKRSKQSDKDLIPRLAEERHGSVVRKEMDDFFKLTMSDHCLTIKPVEKGKLELLFNELVKIHAIAYQWNPPAEKAREAISNIDTNGPVRVYIRAILEALDQIYFYGSSELIMQQPVKEPVVEERDDLPEQTDENPTE